MAIHFWISPLTTLNAHSGEMQLNGTHRLGAGFDGGSLRGPMIPLQKFQMTGEFQ